jgi:dual-specificity kinase
VAATAQSHPLPSATAKPSSSSSNVPPYVNNNSNSVSMSSGASARRKKPNWQEFYKNGLPKEVIVIDDTPPPDQTTASSRTVVAAGVNGQQPAGKKRRTGVETAYDLSYHDRPSYSMNPQQYGDHHSSAGSLSTDRTTSLHTTAPTSLGSAGSVGTSNGVYFEDANIGQKRKRNTRTSTRQEAKRRELETVGDAFLSYVPPPQPPIKAKDVPVPVIRDVIFFFPLF